MPTYVETAIAECPECGDTHPGHVYRVDGAGVFGWTCPVCAHTSDPHRLDTRTVEVSG